MTFWLRPADAGPVLVIERSGFGTSAPMTGFAICTFPPTLLSPIPSELPVLRCAPGRRMVEKKMSLVATDDETVSVYVDDPVPAPVRVGPAVIDAPAPGDQPKRSWRPGVVPFTKLNGRTTTCEPGPFVICRRNGIV